MRLAVIGQGNVGAPLARQLARAGHDVVVGGRGAAVGTVTPEDAPVLAPAEAVEGARLVLLAVPFRAVPEVLEQVAPRLAADAVLVDCTNPVGPGLTHGLENRESGTQLVARLAGGVPVVKAFSVYGYETLEDHQRPGLGVRAAMPFCGDSAAAKALVAGVLDELGWEPLDVGGLEQALHLEHMTLLWVRMVRVDGHPPTLLWAALT